MELWISIQMTICEGWVQGSLVIEPHDRASDEARDSRFRTCGKFEKGRADHNCLGGPHTRAGVAGAAVASRGSAPVLPFGGSTAAAPSLAHDTRGSRAYRDRPIVPMGKQER